MNERIKQLYEQAGMKFLLGSVESFDIINFNPEKFAELIVRECANIIPETAGNMSGTYRDQIDELFGIEQSVERLKQALASPVVDMPAGLNREERRAFILKVAAQGGNE